MYELIEDREKYSVACRNFHRFVALTIPYDPSAEISLTLRTSCANQGARWREISSMEINFAVAGARDRVRYLCVWRHHQKLSNVHLSRTTVWTRTIENNCRDVGFPRARIKDRPEFCLFYRKILFFLPRFSRCFVTVISMFLWTSNF